ncbi:PH domain-containing protein [Halomicrobium salinisoli]|uniref:PH domain-containing protein n=1 Tax=Halomicrobium salinisoli TaxID=2878391 RepID=UPI001CF05AE1|nr:PH domain-containing protein [Halomicrobium salinisoli]
MPSEPEWLSEESDETVVWTGQPRVWRIWRTVAAAVLVSALTVGGVGFVTVRGGLDGGAESVLAWALAGLTVVAMGAAVVSAYLRVQHTDYVLTDEHVYAKTGVLSQRVTGLGLDRVQETTLSKGVAGNHFDYGTVAISTAGSAGTDLALSDLNDPESFRDLLQERVRQASAGEDDGEGAPVDARTADALLTEARGLRQVAERLEESV